MRTLQKAVVMAAIAAAIWFGIYQARRASRLLDQVEALQQQQAPLIAQVQQLQRDRDHARAQVTALLEEKQGVDHSTAELLKLRGQVGALKRQLAEASTTKTPLSPTGKASAAADSFGEQMRMTKVLATEGKNYSMHFVLFSMNNQ